MANSLRALVIGGSIGGLFAGHLLRQAGWRVTVFERSAGDLSDRGAGLGVSAELFDVMRRVGIRISQSLAVKLRSAVWLDQNGKVVYEIGRAAQGSAWPTIYRPLRATFPDALYRSATALERVEQDGGGVTAIFADGTRERADLLVAADGIFSTVRRQYLPLVKPNAAGYIAWRGTIAEHELPQASQALLAHRIAFSFPEGEMVLSVHIPGPDNDSRIGHRRYYFIWYRPTDAARQAEMFTDATGRAHGVSIPPPLIRPEFIAEMKAAAQAKLSPVVADIVARTAQPLLQSITDLESPRIVFGRVALLGDSAFVARPHVAAGTTKAALDAAALADAIEACPGDLDGALARYERERSEFGRAIIAHSRYLGAYLEAQLKPPEERGEAGKRDPVRLMQDYGAPHLVHEVDFDLLEDESPA